MSLHLLLDENMSQVVAAQIRHHQPALVVESVHVWRNGAFEGRSDKALLQAAYAEDLTIVTYDQKTIAAFIDGNVCRRREVTPEKASFSLDDRTIPSDDFGKLTRALIFLWEQYHHEDWAKPPSIFRFLKRTIHMTSPLNNLALAASRHSDQARVVV